MSQKNQQRIFLVGPMGAGKSTIGKSLALVTQKAFLDIDEEIVRFAKRSIPTIFQEDGESVFRQIETQVLKNCLKYDAIIATGGGIIGKEENRAILKENGLVIYLHASVETQYLRTLKDNGRPMIAVDDRRAKLNEIFNVRYPLYKEVADLEIDTNTHTVHECVELIKAKLKEMSWNLSL
ncbi:MAG: shikimate kinase [Succinivibrio sp.]|nr:shikimate kinase [Succinivibrio sp.]MCI7773546.1 shikimate kinase [Succinivibrio sp.]MCI7785587.1 shikimate kinase [Succinivibrio sp.]MDY5324289.1 shikimate kinase [Succinivibrio sp.]